MFGVFPDPSILLPLHICVFSGLMPLFFPFIVEFSQQLNDAPATTCILHVLGGYTRTATLSMSCCRQASNVLPH